MGYSAEEDMVRVDFFKPSGKYYTTEAVKWTGKYNGGEDGQLIHDAFKKSLRDHFNREGDRPDRLHEMDAICLHPYHEYEHPIMLKAGSWLEEKIDEELEAIKKYADFTSKDLTKGEPYGGGQ